MAIQCVRVSRTSTPWFVIERFVINGWHQRTARRGVEIH
jgi:hypothetical protein